MLADMLTFYVGCFSLELETFEHENHQIVSFAGSARVDLVALQVAPPQGVEATR
jgi:hypothetical protein